MDLKEISTHDLVAELESREGVEVSIIGPSASVAVTASGPAVLLLVID